MPIFLILMVLVAAVMASPYVALFYWLAPSTTAGIVGTFALASGLLLLIMVLIGIIMHHRNNR
ncbi:hypothetical protein B9T12_07215 [Wohlfahrtiimonas chitiniclastica]|uniref:hypothetical protein n=1 Tax=Wohlfahrtiimonas chitiniclastica TaxID=400946 RepID=UPI0003680839|nr:hypothetical protein [Wohlfahrtiimonas chitiniclastica]OYQ77747.1 hypothetical protein B9T12_07215 [Wohlfahrtiimonas chitiniclastica]